MDCGLESESRGGGASGAATDATAVDMAKTFEGNACNSGSYWFESQDVSKTRSNVRRKSLQSRFQDRLRCFTGRMDVQVQRNSRRPLDGQP